MTLSKFTIKHDSPTAAAFIDLRMAIGWGGSDVAMVEASLANSLFHVTIYQENKLIAMGRVVGDGAMYFYVQDVVVGPHYQGQGIGNSLMNEIEGYLSQTAKSGATIGLLAAKGKEGFYQHFGYQQRPSDTLGNGMCKFIT
ncbi:GNAT family N-acetyltransferase [Cognaticolwellia mytili]|uniref:GNAT family N-acetyltransferase n=1 Tax=Cognaticolwellia mytili TaxID=1888913 RepID=UPI000A17253A|nr:GNAT family N-acetyltransferase [Cognaticolwellia mytili]